MNSSFNDDCFYFYRFKNEHEHFDIKIYRNSQGKNTKGTDYKSPHSVMAVLWRSLSALSCRRLPIIPGAKLTQLSINIYTHCGYLMNFPFFISDYFSKNTYSLSAILYVEQAELPIKLTSSPSSGNLEAFPI